MHTEPRGSSEVRQIKATLPFFRSFCCSPLYFSFNVRMALPQNQAMSCPRGLQMQNPMELHWLGRGAFSKSSSFSSTGLMSWWRSSHAFAKDAASSTFASGCDAREREQACALPRKLLYCWATFVPWRRVWDSWLETRGDCTHFHSRNTRKQVLIPCAEPKSETNTTKPFFP